MVYSSLYEIQADNYENFNNIVYHKIIWRWLIANKGSEIAWCDRVEYVLAARMRSLPPQIKINLRRAYPSSVKIHTRSRIPGLRSLCFMPWWRWECSASSFTYIHTCDHRKTRSSRYSMFEWRTQYRDVKNMIITDESIIILIAIKFCPFVSCIFILSIVNLTELKKEKKLKHIELKNWWSSYWDNLSQIVSLLIFTNRWLYYI